jgi:ribosomal protein S18 acetylase RimI-like enzyme
VFVAQQFAAQTQAYVGGYPAASHDIVLVDGSPAGQLRVDRGREELRLVDVSLLPEHRSRGIGTLLVSALQDEARQRDQPLTLSVLAHNPARRLYERLGFAATDAGGAHVAMCWQP